MAFTTGNHIIAHNKAKKNIKTTKYFHRSFVCKMDKIKDNQDKNKSFGQVHIIIPLYTWFFTMYNTIYIEIFAIEW